MQSTLASKSSGDRVIMIATAITAAWERYLPYFHIPPMQDNATIQAEDDAKSTSSSSSHTKGLDCSFDSYTVHMLADYLKSLAVYLALAVMGIDKCTSQCRIICPH